jgi:hypothetical protein
MGRPSTGPPIRYASSASVDAGMSAATSSSPAEDSPTEVAPDIDSWPGTAEAARIVGRHTSTIKLWRAQGRIRALQDGSGCWRYHPEDLAESANTPDGTDPGTILAQGMTAIVSQGASANERLLAMTELATDGLKDAASVLSQELRRAYTKIAELEKETSELRRQMASERGEELKHERYIRRLDHKHELELAGSRETSARLQGLLTIVGPIAASIGARLVGDLASAERAERKTAASPGLGVEPSPPPTPESQSRLVPIETRITEAMARLCDAIRRLDEPAFAGLRAMMPPSVAEALDAVKRADSDGVVGQALAILVQAAQNLSDLQFRMLRPIAPADITAVLAELRELMRSGAPPADEVRS